jgi:16S rRNA (cytidine1402-2'-O)-methyltransferase
VCRELTKTYEEVRRGPLEELADWAGDGLRGEITLVVGGAPAEAAAAWDVSRVRAELDELVTAGMKKKDAARLVADLSGWPQREVYRIAAGE